ncbi:hypothetical protein ES288_A08G195400v1 [Gossypium darwinii]|uniref:Uncharacterized protein n=1 Tax=Gossypium darwinii TaxID=34276 RepID=A0A5D2FMK4_GOSDA|nr:hypothetical protein ES288_A08G195400v1 [Gossypium darwinii]
MQTSFREDALRGFNLKNMEMIRCSTSLFDVATENNLVSLIKQLRSRPCNTSQADEVLKIKLEDQVVAISPDEVYTICKHDATRMLTVVFLDKVHAATKVDATVQFQFHFITLSNIL